MNESALFYLLLSLYFPQVESSPGPISPPDERHNISSGSGNSSAAGGGGSGAPMMATNMPLSDNNVSTTNMAMVNTAWDMPDSEQDINVSVVFDLSQRQNSSRGAAFS